MVKHLLLPGDNWQRISHFSFSKEKKTVITAESLEINLAGSTGKRKGEEIKLTATECELLA